VVYEDCFMQMDNLSLTFLKEKPNLQTILKLTPNNIPVTYAQIITIYYQLARARKLDAKCITLYKQNKCFFQVGCAGHELIQVIAAQIFQAERDWFWPYYRDLALVTSLGMSNYEILLNFLNKREDPNSGGRQMPMHFGSKKLNIFTQSSPTGTQYLQAVGNALGAKKRGIKAVTYVSSGEGSCAQGDFHEALNWASRDKLPIIFLIQNNGYAISVPFCEQIANDSITSLVSGYKNLRATQTNGCDLGASYEAVLTSYNYVQAGKGPALIEAMVPRLQSHSISDNQLKYRSEEEIKLDEARDPKTALINLILSNNILLEEELKEIDNLINEDIERELLRAEAATDNHPDTVLDFVYDNNDPALYFKEKISAKSNLSSDEPIILVDAINQALKEELDFNKDVLIYGQDVAKGKGGVFGVTSNLTSQFGDSRVFNSQLAESAIVGVAIGLTTYGYKPVVEIQFGDYVWTAMMQIRNELAMIHYRSSGQFRVPCVIRIPVGGYIQGSAYHSQNIEAVFTHIPGIFVVFPSNSYDAKGLLKSSIRSSNPVLFLEHKGLYRQPYTKSLVGDENLLLPLGKAKIVSSGTDLTIISWGYLLHKSLQAAKRLENEGFSVEVIDLRTLVPLDWTTIFNSVNKTNRALIVQEDSVFVSLASEIAATIQEECFFKLEAPVRRIGMKPVGHVPHPQALEDRALVQESDIFNAAKDLLIF
jgi:2-oxoisovalerate dehydrogenase E1 component